MRFRRGSATERSDRAAPRRAYVSRAVGAWTTAPSPACAPRQCLARRRQSRWGRWAVRGCRRTCSSLSPETAGMAGWAPSRRPRRSNARQSEPCRARLIRSHARTHPRFSGDGSLAPRRKWGAGITPRACSQSDAQAAAADARAGVLLQAAYHFAPPHHSRASGVRLSNSASARERGVLNLEFSQSCRGRGDASQVGRDADARVDDARRSGAYSRAMPDESHLIARIAEVVVARAPTVVRVVGSSGILLWIRSRHGWGCCRSAER